MTETTTITTQGEKVTCRSEQTGEHITNIVTIDGQFYSQDSIGAQNGWTDEETEARCESCNVAAMIDHRMIRRTANGWEMAENAELPVPVGYAPEFAEAQR